MKELLQRYLASQFHERTSAILLFLILYAIIIIGPIILWGLRH